MGNSKNLCVFNFVILLKSRYFDACKIYVFYSTRLKGNLVDKLLTIHGSSFCCSYSFVSMITIPNLSHFEWSFHLFWEVNKLPTQLTWIVSTHLLCTRTIPVNSIQCLLQYSILVKMRRNYFSVKSELACFWTTRYYLTLCSGHGLAQFNEKQNFTPFLSSSLWSIFNSFQKGYEAVLVWEFQCNCTMKTTSCAQLWLEIAFVSNVDAVRVLTWHPVWEVDLDLLASYFQLMSVGRVSGAMPAKHANRLNNFNRLKSSGIIQLHFTMFSDIWV